MWLNDIMSASASFMVETTGSLIPKLNSPSEQRILNKFERHSSWKDVFEFCGQLWCKQTSGQTTRCLPS